MDRVLPLYTGTEGYVYLASPYSDKSESLKRERHDISCRVAAKLINKGVILFAPIAQSAAIVTNGVGIGSDWQTWCRFDKLFVAKSKYVYVITMDGWGRSVGVAAETEYANELEIPVYYIDPETLILTDRSPV